MTKRTIAIAGGIGSGKSMVSAVLRMMDYPVYDCDSRAKKLMASDGMLRRRLIENFGEAVFEEGVLNRSYLSRLVFGDVEKLARLNAIVHPCVKSDFEDWRCCQSANVVFVETAILSESGMDKMVDSVWQVVAPEKLRVERVMKRNNLSREAVEMRMRNQTLELEEKLPLAMVLNDGQHSILQQIEALLQVEFQRLNQDIN